MLGWRQNKLIYVQKCSPQFSYPIKSPFRQKCVWIDEAETMHVGNTEMQISYDKTEIKNCSHVPNGWGDLCSHLRFKVPLSQTSVWSVSQHCTRHTFAHFHFLLHLYCSFSWYLPSHGAMSKERCSVLQEYLHTGLATPGCIPKSCVLLTLRCGSALRIYTGGKGVNATCFKEVQDVFTSLLTGTLGKSWN